MVEVIYTLSIVLGTLWLIGKGYLRFGKRK